MDIKLRGEMDGLRAADLIHECTDVPVIFITALLMKTPYRVKESSAFGYILKPFQEREVLIAIEMALYKFRLERELREAVNG
jgi:CheY-like chemotaxis protein